MTIVKGTQAKERPEPRYSRYGNSLWSVTQIISGSGIAPPLNVPDEILKAKGRIGDNLHAYIAARLLDKPRVLNRITSQMPERTDLHIQQFEEWFHTTFLNLEVIFVEEPLYYDDVFAGTPDLFAIAELRSGDTFYGLFDWKCRKAKRHDRFQTRAYKALVTKKYCDEISGKVRRFVCSFTEKSYKMTEHVHDQYDWTIFSSACHVWDEKVRIGNY